MSLILDALNKADRQRDHKEPVPSLGSYHGEPKRQNPSIIPIWAIYTVVGLLVLVVLALMLLVFKDGDRRAEVELEGAAIVGADSQPAPIINSMAVQEELLMPTVAQAKLNDPIISSEVSAIYQQVGEGFKVKPVRPEGAIASLYADKPKASTANDFRAGATRPAEAARVEKKSAELLLEENELQAMWDATQAESTNTQAKPLVPSDPYQGIPYLHQLPESFKERIPTIKYGNHIFSPKGGAVILNGKTYRVGDQLAQDLVVDAITEEDLVLSYLKKPFKLAALSSWIQVQ